MGRARHSPNRRETLRYSTWQAAGESHLSKLSHPVKCLAAVGQDKLKKPDQFSTYQVLFRRPSETLKVGLKRSAHSCSGNGVGGQNIGKKFLIPDTVSTSIMFWDVVFLRISQKAAHSSLQHSLSCTGVLPTDCTPQREAPCMDLIIMQTPPSLLTAEPTD